MAALDTVAIHDPLFPERRQVINLSDFEEEQHVRWGEIKAVVPPADSAQSAPALAAGVGLAETSEDVPEAAAQDAPVTTPARKKPGPRPKAKG